MESHHQVTPGSLFSAGYYFVLLNFYLQGIWVHLYLKLSCQMYSNSNMKKKIKHNINFCYVETFQIHISIHSLL